MKSMSGSWRAAAALALALGFSVGCSLLTIKTEVEPLPPNDLKARIMTRDLVTVFADRVQIAADEIIAKTDESDVRRAALRWKIGAIEAARRAGTRQDPREALVDTWALCVQQRDFLKSDAGAGLFGSQRALALEASERLVADVTKVAEATIDPDLRALMAVTIDDYARRHPIADLEFAREPVLPLWLEAAAGRGRVKTVGSTPEVIQEVSGRLGSIGQGLSDTVRWRTELALADRENEIKDVYDLLERLDAGLKAVIALAETSPELAAQAARELQRELGPSLEQLDRRWGQSLVTLAEQREAVVEDLERIQTSVAETLRVEREALTAAVDQQRGAIMEEAGVIAADVTDRALEKVRATLREALLLIIVLAIVVLGLPFGAGYLVGRMRAGSAAR